MSQVTLSDRLMKPMRLKVLTQLEAGWQDSILFWTASERKRTGWQTEDFLKAQTDHCYAELAKVRATLAVVKEL